MSAKPESRSAAFTPLQHSNIRNPGSGLTPATTPTVKRALESLRSLAGQLVALQAEARALGLFANDRELLACPRCGLAEDVTCTGLLITCRLPALGEDTGLRFEEIKTGKFRCPQCGGIVAEIPEKPATKTKRAKKRLRK